MGWKGVDKKLADKVAKNLLIWALILVIFCLDRTRGRRNLLEIWSRCRRFLNQVDVDVWKNFVEKKPNDELALDLVGYVKQQLTKNGILLKNIEVSPVDTVLDKNYFRSLEVTS